MTPPDFLAFYPQFADVFPDVVLESYVALANARFAQYCEDAEEARRLYVAHKLTMYAKTMPVSADGSEAGFSYASLASSGEGAKITSKRVENVAVTYSTGSSGSASANGMEELYETEYGKQLLALMRIYSYPRYVP